MATWKHTPRRWLILTSVLLALAGAAAFWLSRPSEQEERVRELTAIVAPDTGVSERDLQQMQQDIDRAREELRQKPAALPPAFVRSDSEQDRQIRESQEKYLLV